MNPARFWPPEQKRQASGRPAISPKRDNISVPNTVQGKKHLEAKRKSDDLREKGFMVLCNSICFSIGGNYEPGNTDTTQAACTL